ncbi:hypothetical protein PSHT_06800 [Puccinia striiformis]|uniref:Uncharacterized protein n=1 Tax=Puccinia striiformis TaxID=27350 RepID=A0A2S4W3A7_9BASI|nr:hypothetical protein PSHT_06800 [Puccinia striiformis]
MVNPTTEPIDIETSPSTYRQGLPDHPSATKKTQGRRPAAMKATKPAAKKPTKPVACKPPNQQLARKMLPIINRPFNQTQTLRLKTITYRQFKRTVSKVLSFLESVVYKCEDQVKNTGSIVSDSLHTGKPVIKWSIIIPRVTRFKKDDGTTVHNEVSFTRWITALSESNATKTTLNLSVINPTKVTKKLHQCYTRTSRSTDNHDDDDDDDDDKEDDEDLVDDVKFHMREIYKFA